VQKHEVIPYYLVREENFPHHISGELVSTGSLELASVASDDGNKESFDDSEISSDGSEDSSPERSLVCNETFNIYESRLFSEKLPNNRDYFRNLKSRKNNNEGLVPIVINQDTPRITCSEKSKSVALAIKETLTPTLFGLSTNSVPELGYEITAEFPGTAYYMDIPFLIWTAVIPPLFALSKYMEQRTKSKNLEYANWFFEKSDTFVSTMVFNLETFGSIWLFIQSIIFDDEYVQYEISDYYNILIYSSLASISLLITLSPLNFYNWMETKFSANKILSTLFHYIDFVASFIEKTVKLEAVGLAIIELLDDFNLGGIKPYEDPIKWFAVKMVPTWIGAITLSSLATYVERREQPMPLLGNKEQRKEEVEFVLQLCTAFAINVFLYSNLWELYKNSEETPADGTLIYISVLSNLILTLIPTGMFIYKISSFFTSSIRAFDFRRSFIEPLLDSDITDNLDTGIANIQEKALDSTQSLDDESNRYETGNLEKNGDDDVVRHVHTSKSHLSFWSKSWCWFFGRKNSNSDVQFMEEKNNPNNLEI
jgi:hypothetical protein